MQCWKRQKPMHRFLQRQKAYTPSDNTQYKAHLQEVYSVTVGVGGHTFLNYHGAVDAQVLLFVQLVQYRTSEHSRKWRIACFRQGREVHTVEFGR